MKCQYTGCDKEGQFGIYKLNSDLTKEWLHLCRQHDMVVAKENHELQRFLPKDTKWLATDILYPKES